MSFHRESDIQHTVRALQLTLNGAGGVPDWNGLEEGVSGALTTYLFCGLTGPFIIMDQAIRLRRSEGQPLGWLFASLFVAALWSCCSGVIVLELVLSVKASIA